jgi:YVTN family beta-propeller protein
MLASVCACAAAGRTSTRLPPLGAEGEVSVYLLPLPREAERLAFTIDSVILRRDDGGEVPLQLVKGVVNGAEPRAQRRLAWGRVPPGQYEGVRLRAGSATLLRDDERSRLLVGEEPSRADVHFGLGEGTAAVLWLALKPAESLHADFGFAPAFTATLAPQTPPQVALYCTDTGTASVTVLDRHARLVTGEVPVGAVPRGIALDRTAARGYVALEAEDQIQILDVAGNTAIGRIRLAPGDGPREVAFAGDGTTLVVLNGRSRSASFVDVVGLNELGRVPVGDAPEALLLDRAGRRAYVVNRGSATISVIDVATRTLVTTLATDPEPLYAQLNRDGSRLYVVHRGSAYLTVFALPSLAPQARAYVGLGATTLRVDSRTDLLYLSRGDERRIAVYDPVSLQPIDQFGVPGAVSYMAIDDAQNTLLALMPGRRGIAVIDLTSRKLVAELPVGAGAYVFAFAGERF